MFFWYGCWVFSKTQKRRWGAKVEGLKFKGEVGDFGINKI